MDELEDLRRWKAEALIVLNQWEQVGREIDMLDPCPLGESRPVHALRAVRRMRSMLRRRCGV